MTGAVPCLSGRAVGEDAVRAELLETLTALRAGAVRIDEAADADEVARFVLRHRRADFHDPADDLVPGHAGVDCGHHVVPLVSLVVQVGVADAAEEDLDLHVAVGRVAARDRVGGERRGRARRRSRLSSCTWRLLLRFLTLWEAALALFGVVQPARLPRSSHCGIARRSPAPASPRLSRRALPESRCASWPWSARPRANASRRAGTRRRRRRDAISPRPGRPSRCAQPTPAVTISVCRAGA